MERRWGFDHGGEGRFFDNRRPGFHSGDGRVEFFGGGDEQGKQNKRRMDERGERNLGGDDLHHRLARDQDRDPTKQQRGGFQRGEREGVVICFRCNQEGHHKSECSNPLLCYNCKASGHMSQSCPRVKVNRGLKLCGFGLPGRLFYSIHVPIEEEDEE